MPAISSSAVESLHGAFLTQDEVKKVGGGGGGDDGKKGKSIDDVYRQVRVGTFGAV